MYEIDLLIVNPDSSSKAYQGLANDYSAIEPPTWALLLAESVRSKGFQIKIFDCDAERSILKAAIDRIGNARARLVLFVVYGQNPNSGTVNMSGALDLALATKKYYPNIKIAFVGSHVSALPIEVLSHEAVDIVLQNEGVYALHDLLQSDLDKDLPLIRGIGYKKNGPANFKIPVLNPPQKVVPQDRMDIDLPGYAWDLLPYKERPLDLYRAHFWHADFDFEKRSPFAAIYTSLGCQFACDFCMINIINRVNNSDGITAADSKGMRFWSTNWVIRQLDILHKMGVRTLRISDEMFFLNKKIYEPLLKEIIKKEYKFNMWAYSRVDTVRKDKLELFKSAGVNWLALGIEAGNQSVRQEVSKGSFKEINIREVCKDIQSSGIKIISNYIFGFPEDNFQTMQETLDLAIELNTEMANMYPCQALPGSPMYENALKNGWKLPNSYSGYGFLSYDAMPLPTKYLSSEEVLSFRDKAWEKYFSRNEYLNMIEKKFGKGRRDNIEDLTKIKLKRKILGD